MALRPSLTPTYDIIEHVYFFHMLHGCFHLAVVTVVTSQCLIHCGNQRMCTQVPPTLILLAAAEKVCSRRQPIKHLL